jgi:hypothetical protein
VLNVWSPISPIFIGGGSLGAEPVDVDVAVVETAPEGGVVSSVAV